MRLAKMHPEDVKAELRKRFATVSAFERRYELPSKSVHDLLRGRASARVEKAIKSVIERPVSEFSKSEGSDVSQTVTSSHRKNAEAR
ncbi:helix-turn-helix domain-containing protein [Sphingobium sp. SA2]|uniref:helix-turn-helix domain-containing protein n=1 Tax=Sphingobium sp. SA2 TaxID=1524832 RepID=UPI00391A7180